MVRFDWLIEPQHYDHMRYGSLEAYAHDLLRVIHAAEAAPCVFVGHSMCGMIGMLAGIIRPQAFTSMVMINPSPCYINDASYEGGFREEDVKALLAGISNDYFAWVQGFAPTVVGGPPDRPEVEEFSRGLRAMRPDVAFSMALTLFRSDLRDKLGKFAVPTTILQSTRDPAVPVAVGEYLRNAWPHSRLRLLDAEGHLPHMTHAPLVMDALADVLGETANATPP